MNPAVWSSIARAGIAVLTGIGCALLINGSLRMVEKRLKETEENGERIKRVKTLLSVGKSIAFGIIILIVLLMILYELGINITPFLASAGIVGLAISLGAQTLIKDFLGGIIILLENQYKIGDSITVGQVTGTVERITLRATYLLDGEGKLSLIPNGDIRSVTNLTTQWSQVVIPFNFDYETDTDLVQRTLEEAIHEMMNGDKELAAVFLERPSVAGWTGFSDWAVQAQISAKTQPGKQGLAARGIRKTALEHLQRKGIRLAVPPGGENTG